MNQSSPRQPLLMHTPNAATADGQARPKIMRRPAQFSTTNAEIIPHGILHPMPNITAEAPLLPNPTPERSWQDDGRFALTLLAIVISINLALSAWLSGITPTNPTPVANAPAKPMNVVILNELNPPESNQ